LNNAIVNIVYTRRYLLVLVYILILLTAVLNVLDLKVEGDLIDLLNQDDPVVKQYKYYTDNFKGSDSFVVVADNNNKEERALDILVGRLKQLRSVDNVVLYSPPVNTEVNGPKTKSAVILLTPDFKPTDMAQSRIMTKAIRNAAEEQGITVGITGSYQVVLETADSITKDMMRSAVITFLAIAFILLIMIKIPFSVVLASMLTIFLGLFVTLWFAEILFDRLTFMTAALPAVLLGLGVDYCLHIIYSFNEKASSIINSSACSDALFQKTSLISYVYKKTVKPMAIGAITTAGAFIALTAADSDGLFELGMVGAAGIMIMFLSAYIFLPVFLSFFKLKQFAPIKGLDSLWSAIFNTFKKRAVILYCVILLILLTSIPFALSVRFTADQNSLLDQDLSSFSLQSKLLSNYKFFPVPAAVISPNDKTEKDKLDFLVNNTFDDISFIQSYSLAAYTGRDPEDFVGLDGSLVTYIYGSTNPFKPDGFNKIRSLADRINQSFSDSGNFVTGSAFLNSSLNETIKSDLLRCSLTAFFLIAIITTLFFRDLKLTVVALVPVFVSLIFTSGLMGILNINFSLMTMVVLPLVIGAGIDDGVHMLWRSKEENGNINRALSGISSPITATSITSCAAFGSLLFAVNPGFRELGLAAMFGMIFCLILSLAVVPPLLSKINLIQKG